LVIPNISIDITQFFFLPFFISCKVFIIGSGVNRHYGLFFAVFCTISEATLCRKYCRITAKSADLSRYWR